MTTIQDGPNKISFLGPQEAKDLAEAGREEQLLEEVFGNADEEETKESIAYRN